MEKKDHQVIDGEISGEGKFSEELIRNIEDTAANIMKSLINESPTDVCSNKESRDEDWEKKARNQLKTEDCTMNSVLGDEGKGKEIFVSGEGCQEYLNKQVGDVGKTSADYGSSSMKRSQDLQFISLQDTCIKRETTDDKKRINVLTQFNFLLRSGATGSPEDVDSDPDDVTIDRFNQSGENTTERKDETTARTEGKGKDVLALKECKEGKQRIE